MFTNTLFKTIQAPPFISYIDTLSDGRLVCVERNYPASIINVWNIKNDTILASTSCEESIDAVLIMTGNRIAIGTNKHVKIYDTNLTLLTQIQNVKLIHQIPNGNLLIGQSSSFTRREGLLKVWDFSTNDRLLDKSIINR